MNYLEVFKTFGLNGGLLIILGILFAWVIKFVLKANEIREERLTKIIENHIHESTESNKELTTVIKELKILIENLSNVIKKE